MRVDAAARLLSVGTEPISLISHDTGFYDHSFYQVIQGGEGNEPECLPQMPWVEPLFSPSTTPQGTQSQK